MCFLIFAFHGREKRLSGGIFLTLNPEKSIPGVILLGPKALLAMFVLVINDHVLKTSWPGWVSGKLSDFAYCYLVPLILFATIEWVTWFAATLKRQPWRMPSRRIAIASCLLVGLHFTAWQLLPGWGEIHVEILGKTLPWFTFRAVPDPMDLIALPMVYLAYRGMLALLNNPDRLQEPF